MLARGEGTRLLQLLAPPSLLMFGSASYIQFTSVSYFSIVVFMFTHTDVTVIS